MHRCLLALLAVTGLAAEDWVSFKSGPFEILSAAGEKAGRDALNDLEQLRWVLGATLGKQDLQTVWPIRIALVKAGRHAPPLHPELRLARDAWVAGAAGLGSGTLSSVTRILIEDNAGRMPPAIERGLLAVFSTFEAENTRVTLGKVPAARDRDWARVHMLIVDPAFSGKLRVLLHNLQQGGEDEPAYKNAFEMSPEQIERRVDAYLEAGNYATANPSGRPFDPRRQLIAREPQPRQAELLLADILFANGRPDAKAAYANLAASDGLGLIELRAGNTAAAREHLSQSKGPRALLELGRLNKDRAPLLEAARIMPRWPEPHRALADLEDAPIRKAFYLKRAAELDFRRAESWRVLAETQEAAGQLADAGKSWAAAVRAASDPEERERTKQARLASEQRRTDRELAEREDARRKAQQEIEDLRNKALADIRAFEARANKGQTPIDRESLGEYREEATHNPKATGIVERVDCLGGQARLHLLIPGGEKMQLLIRDPNKIVLGGGGEMSLGCGVQRGNRRASIEYVPRKDARFGTAGDVRVIEFR